MEYCMEKSQARIIGLYREKKVEQLPEVIITAIRYYLGATRTDISLVL
jgi:hypothetical protein